MRRRWWVWLAALPVVAVVADYAVWQVSVYRLESGFRAWIADRDSHGWKVTVSDRKTGGWPFAATLTVTDLAMAGGEPAVPGGAYWDVKQLVLKVDLLEPWTLDISPIGVQRVRFGNGPDLPFVAENVHITLPLQSDEKSTHLTMVVDRLRAELPTDNEPSATVTVDRIEGHADLTPTAAAGEPAVAFSVTAGPVGLPRQGRWPLGPTLSSLSVDGALEGPLPAPAAPATWAAAWRDGGGSLEIQKLNLVWGPLTVAGSATLALDDQLQPMGAGNSRIVGYDATLDALAGNGVLTRSAAKAAKAVLSLLADTPPGGEQPEVEVPLTLQLRTLSMRQVPLVRLPELDWGGP